MGVGSRWKQMSTMTENYQSSLAKQGRGEYVKTGESSKHKCWWVRKRFLAYWNDEDLFDVERKKENQKSDLSVQHFFWNIHRVIASWIFEWLMVEKILLANTINSQFKVIPRKFVHFGKTFSLLKFSSSAQKLVNKDHVDDVYNQM